MKYKIPEILDKAKVNQPKIIIMLTDLKLSFTDGINLETLLASILADRRVKARNIKVLSFDSFTKELIEGHTEFKEIDVATNLQKVVCSIVKDAETPDIVDLINDKVLSSTNDDVTNGTLGMSYNPSDVEYDNNPAALQSSGDSLIGSVAVIDTDPNTATMIQSKLSRSTRVQSFNNAPDFLTTIYKQHFDIVVLEINIPGMTGLDILRVLQGRHYTNPVVVYSSVSDKAVIYKAISCGARTYLTKPQNAETLVKKLKDVIQQDF